MQTHTLSCVNSWKKIAENNAVNLGQHTALTASVCHKPMSFTKGIYSGCKKDISIAPATVEENPDKNA